MSLRALVVEENLRSRKGHQFQYAYALANSKSAGERLRIEFAVHRNAEYEVLSTFHAHPVFHRSRLEKNWFHQMPGFRYISFLLHNFAVFRALARHLRMSNGYDYIIFPTASFHHILAAYFLQILFPEKATRIVLFFVTQCTVWPDGLSAPVFELTSKLLSAELRLLRPFVRQKRTVLAVETSCAQHEYQKLSGLPVGLWPHPVTTKSITRCKNTSSPIVFGSLGFARHEKGSDLLAKAIEHCLDEALFSDTRFVLQWGEDFIGADGIRVSLSDRVRSDPRVTAIDSPLDEKAYSELLDSISVLILPYRRSSYYGRLSRVSVEAACHGIPMIVTPETHLAHVVADMGAGLLMDKENVESLVVAMIRYLGCALECTEQASLRVPRARTYYSPENFLQTMMKSFEP